MTDNNKKAGPRRQRMLRCLKNHKIKKNNKNGLLWGLNPQSLDYEANALPLDQLDMLCVMVTCKSI